MADVADVAGDGDAEPPVIPFAMASFTRSTSSIFSKQSCRKLGGPDPELPRVPFRCSLEDQIGLPRLMSGFAFLQVQAQLTRWPLGDISWPLKETKCPVTRGCRF